MMAARGHKTYTCATGNTELGIFRSRKKKKNREICLEIFMIALLFFFPSFFSYAEEKNKKRCLEIFMVVPFFFMFSYAENIGIQNTPKSYRVCINQ